MIPSLDFSLAFQAELRAIVSMHAGLRVGTDEEDQARKTFWPHMAGTERSPPFPYSAVCEWHFVRIVAGGLQEP